METPKKRKPLNLKTKKSKKIEDQEPHESSYYDSDHATTKHISDNWIKFYIESFKVFVSILFAVLGTILIAILVFVEEEKRWETFIQMGNWLSEKWGPFSLGAVVSAHSKKLGEKITNQLNGKK